MGSVGTAAGSLLGGDMSGDVAAQQAAAANANAIAKGQYGQTRQDLMPYMNAGAAALAGMQNPSFQQSFTPGDLTQDPGYQFRMQQGLQALQRSAAAGGNLMSGATMKAITNYGQNAASQEYQNAFDRFQQDQQNRFGRLATVAGLGQNSAAQTGSFGANYAQTAGNNVTGAANAQAAGDIATANRGSQLLGQGLGAAALAFSDERLKTNIRPISKEDLAELRATIKPYAFRYADPAAHGDGEWIGVMAQDLEKSKLGRSLVFTDEDGHKRVNLKKVGALFLATVAEAA